MKYSIDRQEKYNVIRVENEKLDSTIAPELKSELVAIQGQGIQNIIVDLSEVKYIDSSGLSSLLVGNRVFAENKGTFILTCISDHAMKLIKISQLDKVLNILPTVEEAVDAVFLLEIENGLLGESE
ncbi:MAG: STAS domain-containing protein [Cyclobacteriaceae bacterium]